jgi:hypothetical protein
MEGEGQSQVSGTRGRKAGRIYVAAVLAVVFTTLALSPFAFATDGTANAESEPGPAVGAGASSEPGGLPFSQLDLALAIGGALVLVGAGALTARLPSGGG